MATPGTLRVLVVEDNPADAWTVREALEGRGSFEATVVGRLGEAVGRLGEADVVVLDLSLPDSNGVETVDRVRKAAPGVPVVVLSGQRDEETAFRCLQHGAQDVLLKGATGGEGIARAVRCALERRALADERDEAVRRSRGSEENLRNVLLASREGMVVTTPGGGVLFANPAAAELPPAILRGEGIGLPPPGGEPVEVESSLPGGEPRCLEVRRTAIAWEGRPAILTTVHDLTRRLLAEKAQRESEVRQGEAAREEVVERLAGGIAQGLKNQLTLVLGHAWLLSSSSLDPVKARVHARQIHNAGKTAALLVDRLLACTRRQRVQMEILDPNEILASLRGPAESLLRPDTRVEVDLAPRSGRVRADRKLLEMAVTILVEHARDSMPGGGRLLLATVPAPPEAPPPGGPAPRPRVALVVGDSGPGLGDEARSRAFEPFYTTEVLGIGSGPGLAPVQGIARLLGGEAAVESTPGKGTIIRILLPVVEEGDGDPSPPPSRTAAAPRPGDLPGGTETILLADRDPAVRWLLASCLHRMGYRVLLARDAGDAVRIASTHPGALDLLIAEADLPGMGGPLLARVLRSARPGIPVLLLADATRSVAPGPKRSPEDPWLLKPFGWGDLAHAVHAALEGRVPNPPTTA